MAPERFRGVTDLRGDVYALGATLYELLTLRQAFDGQSHPELVQQIRDQAPRALRQHDRHVPRDLETIVLKALAKDPKDRFATAGELRDELHRFLESRPIRSRPVGAAERVWRWCRRNPYVAGLLGAVAGLTLALALGSTAAALWFKHANDREMRTSADLRAANQRERQRFNLAMDAVKLFHGDVSEDLLLKEKPFEGLRTKLLHRAADFYTRLEGLLKGQTDQQSRAALGKAYYELADLTDKIGSKSEALAVHRKALAVRRELADGPRADTSTRVDVARSLVAVGWLQESTGDTPGALVSFEEARGLAEGLTATVRANEELQTVLGLVNERIGTLLHGIQKPADARAPYERALAIRQDLADAHPSIAQFTRDLAGTHNRIAQVLAAIGEPVEAIAANQRALEIQRRLADTNPNDTQLQSDLAYSHLNTGYLLMLIGKTAEALEAFRRELAIRQRLADANPNVTQLQFNLARNHAHIGWALRSIGNRAEELAAYERAFVISQRLVTAHPHVHEFQNRLAWCHTAFARIRQEAGRTAEAASSWRQAIAIYERSPAPEFYNLCCTHAQLASLARDPSSGMTVAEGRAGAERAMYWLRQAVAGGYRNVALMRRDTDLDPLRSRPDFQLLMMDLEFPSEPFGSAGEQR
jgi:tetratricopeptide (TPR) repeat protein